MSDIADPTSVYVVDTCLHVHRFGTILYCPIIRNLVQRDGVRWLQAKGSINDLRLGRDCALTEADALTLAETMRAKEIAALRRRITRLEDIKFVVKDWP